MGTNKFVEFSDLPQEMQDYYSSPIGLGRIVKQRSIVKFIYFVMRSNGNQDVWTFVDGEYKFFRTIDPWINDRR